MPPSERIEVIGLKEFSKELRKLEGDWPKELRKAAKSAASLVANEAQRRARTVGGAIGKAAPSIRPGGTQRGAYVKLGGDRYPFALGGEFGAIRFKQFKPWRGSGGDAGYALYPAIRAKTDEVVEEFGDALDDISRQAFPD